MDGTSVARPAEHAVDAGGVGGRESGILRPTLLAPRWRALELSGWKRSGLRCPRGKSGATWGR